MDWRKVGECRGCDPELFFPQRGEDTTAAKAICRQCIVRSQCLEDVLLRPKEPGVWGGTTEAERRRMRRDMTREAA